MNIKYQNVRNMMYVITVTILGFALTGKNVSAYIFLLPLIVILPSYIISFDHWKCVIKVATYLVVFHEKKKSSPLKWETRHRKFNEYSKIMSQSDYLKVPYIVCNIACILLYFIHIKYENCIEITLGIVSICISVILFLVYRKIDEKIFIEGWETVKKQEKEECRKN